MGETSIEWTDRSVNPFRARLPGAGTKGGYNSGVGHYCEKVSPGCKNCYSSATQPRFGLPQFQEQRNGVVEPFFDASKLVEVLRRKAPTKWFWCDMTDMFGDWVPFEWIAACFGVMAATPHHTHQVLTKRAGRMVEFFRWLSVWEASREGFGHVVEHQRRVFALKHLAEVVLGTSVVVGAGVAKWPLPNLHLGVSVEDQRRADERIPLLLQCPAAVRWVSAEPLLSAVDFAPWIERIDHCGSCLAENPPQEADACPSCGNSLISTWGEEQAEGFRTKERYDRSGVRESHDGPQLHWVVVGGESGPGARPFDIAWARSIVGQCKAAGVPVFYKQGGSSNRCVHSAKGGCLDCAPEDLRVREYPQ